MRAGNAGYEIKSPYPALFHGFINRARPKTVIFPNLFVPAERDLRFASTGSNYNSRNTQCFHVVIIFFILDLEKTISFSDCLLVGLSQDAKAGGSAPTSVP